MSAAGAIDLFTPDKTIFAELSFAVTCDINSEMRCNKSSNRWSNKAEARALPAQPGFWITLAFRGG